MDRSTSTVSTRVLLWGVVAPLVVGGFVPPLAGIAMLWLLVGLGTLMVQAIRDAVQGIDPTEDDESDDLHDELAAALPVPVPTRWWNRRDEDPNLAAARVGSWG
ncbi:hypothetical protein SAMN05660199_03202 [Klenkia soli]|uniref:Uncharacterized protein n=1 Tax=Klenkia soli TaxID=1052260 RepID=A0A1H0Q4Q1_9ACTN|nr:hypothetical protein [Klenkia soli]SDP12005.1 hypothetical protein SAMN05660199_03202 [Klenkia soli]